VDVKITNGLTVTGDAALLEVAMQNLLSNAWKFTTRQSKPRIEFGAEPRNGAQVFFVRDNGAGFRMEDANKLFQPFQRLHTAADFQGTGVGLATVQRVISRHQGRIWAEAEPGKGAAFYFQVVA
jgi:light-regulated signal transduction histidine kinase (bacteriophytochrome)